RREDRGRGAGLPRRRSSGSACRTHDTMIGVGRSVVILVAAVLLALPVVAAADGIMLVQAGAFWMGRDDGPPDEAPLHRVYVRDFWIERHKVTNAEFAAFSEYDRPAPDRPRATIRRGRRRRAHPPLSRPLGRRSGIRAPSRGGGLLVRRARLLRVERS